MVGHGIHTLFQRKGAPLSIRKNNNKGRFVVANKDMKAGEVVLIDQPYAVVVDEDVKEHVCDNCFKNSEQKFTISCSKCERTFYCSEECQVAEYDNHFHECPIFKKLDCTKFDAYIFQVIKLIIRVLNYRAQETQKEKSSSNADNVTFRHVSKLIGNTSSFPHDKMQVINSAADYVLSLVDKDDPSAGGFLLSVDRQEIIELWCKEECNSFGLWRPNSGGVGIYPGASYFNHSCVPNIYRVEEGSTLVFRTICDISANTELCLSYINPELHVLKRQVLLKDEYYFQCDCIRCISEMNTNIEGDNVVQQVNLVLSSKCPLPDCNGSFCQQGTELYTCSTCKLRRIRWTLFTNSA